MSMGGDFYALSQESLDRILNEDVSFFDVYDLEPGDGGPSEVFSNGESAWHVLSVLLANEGATGEEHTELVPELAFYSDSDGVKSTADYLEELTEEEFRARFEDAEFQDQELYRGEYWKENFEELWDIVRELTVFYRRIATRDEAILFRVT